MSFEFALDELYATGWSDLDSSGCSHHRDGRAYPRPDRVKQEFAAAGVDLTIEKVDAFNCYRAKWTDADTGQPVTVVGACEAEAAVFALARLRRQPVGA
jgi:hypothetical protein